MSGTASTNLSGPDPRTAPRSQSRMRRVCGPVASSASQVAYWAWCLCLRFSSTS